MTLAQARSLAVGDRIVWRQHRGAPVAGAVVEVGHGGVRVEWVDGQAGWLAFCDLEDLPGLSEVRRLQ